LKIGCHPDKWKKKVVLEEVQKITNVAEVVVEGGPGPR